MLGVMRGILDKYGKDENFFPSFELSIITNERGVSKIRTKCFNFIEIISKVILQANFND